MAEQRSDEQISADIAYAAKGPATYRRLAGDVPALLDRALRAETEAAKANAILSAFRSANARQLTLIERADSRATEVAANAYRDAADEVHREAFWQIEMTKRGRSYGTSFERLAVVEQVLRDRAVQVSVLGAEPAEVQP